MWPPSSPSPAPCWKRPAWTAQTATSIYQPGVTQEGATFFLPKTAIRLTIKVEKTTYTPGDFAPYAERFLRLSNVSMEPATTYRLISIQQAAIGVRDTTKAFTVKFNRKTSAININLAEDGVILAVNAQAQRQEPSIHFKPAQKPTAVNPRQFMNEEILAAGSTAKMAQLTAQEIYEIRDSHSQLIKGQADFMPKDGLQLRLMLDQLETQDKALTSLFSGTWDRDTTEQEMTISIDREMQQHLLFRFSKYFGMVDADDMSGAPYYLTIEDQTQLPGSNTVGQSKKKKEMNGLYYNVPGKMHAVIYNGENTVSEEYFPAAQFGNVELLSGDLFNKHYGTKVWFNPLTGAIDRLEAERPK